MNLPAMAGTAAMRGALAGKRPRSPETGVSVLGGGRQSPVPNGTEKGESLHAKKLATGLGKSSTGSGTGGGNGAGGNVGVMSIGGVGGSAGHGANAGPSLGGDGTGSSTLSKGPPKKVILLGHVPHAYASSARES